MSLNGTARRDSSLGESAEFLGDGSVLGKIEGREPGADKIGQMALPYLSVLNDADGVFEQDGAGPRPSGRNSAERSASSGSRRAVRLGTT